MKLVNLTQKNSSIISDMLDIIAVHAGICSDIEVCYIEREDQAKNGAVNIVADQSMHINVQYNSNYFIINPLREQKEGYFVNDGKFILNFDILRMMEIAVFGDLEFVDSTMFTFAFMERVMDIFMECARSMARHFNIDFKTVSSSPGGFSGYFAPTFDIDRLNYSNWQKTLYYKFLELFHIKQEKTRQYRHVMRISSSDPWDNIEEIRDMLDSNDIKGIFNLLTVQRDRYARRYSIQTARKTAGKLNNHLIGIHLTHESGGNRHRIEGEIKRFGSITDNVQISRFHYLHDPKMSDFAVLDKMGIVLDSSSGFRQRCGFKRGFSKPYRIPGMNIIELPVICMDSAYMLSNREGMEQICDEIKATGGFLTFIFHQSALNEHTFPGYRQFLETMMDMKQSSSLYHDDILNMIYAFNNRIREQLELYEYSGRE